jgi:hypothetical protein
MDGEAEVLDLKFANLRQRYGRTPLYTYVYILFPDHYIAAPCARRPRPGLQTPINNH